MLEQLTESQLIGHAIIMVMLVPAILYTFWDLIVWILKKGCISTGHIADKEVDNEG